MARFRTLEEIILSMLSFGTTAQPDADLSPGAVLRDLTIDMPSMEIAKIYDELRTSAGFQAILSAQGSDIDKNARNFGLSRLSGTTASGSILLTTNVLNSDILIAVNSVVTARNGQSFRVIANANMEATKPNLYRSVAVRYSTALQYAGIFDQYAIEVPVEAVSIGTGGNIGKYQVTIHNIPGISNVTNVNPFRGGTTVENDAAFKNRILSVFRGSAIGTETAYKAAIATDSRVVSSNLIGPGNILMTRDGTVVKIAQDGTPYISTSGSGGKLDIMIQGEDIQRNIESYIYVDRSGRLDATDIANDYILGQRPSDKVLDFPQRRREASLTGLYPFQPVKELVSLTGSLSGPNFQAAYIDEFGIERGNFKLIKDTGAYGGSAFGFDKIHFISNEIDFKDEQVSKPQLYSTDPLDFTEVNEIKDIEQSVPILREVATLDTNRQFVKLQHTPFSSVDRIINATTGERYRIVSSNPDGVIGQPNITGRVQISGSTLPRTNDIIEASYNWTYSYDKDVDFDNLINPNRTRVALDSVDWGFGTLVKLEENSTLFSVPDGYHLLTNFPIAKVINVLTYAEQTVARTNGKLTVSSNIDNILSVLDSDGKEVFFTKENNGTVSGQVISLPTDTLLLETELATVRYNTIDIFSPAAIDVGTFSGNKIVFNEAIAPNTPVLVDYVCAYNEMFGSTPLLNLPAIGSENEWAINGLLQGAQPSTFDWVAGEREKLSRLSPSHIRFNFANLASAGRIVIKGKVWKKISKIFTYTGSTLGILDLNNVIIAELGKTATLSKVVEFAKVQESNGKLVRKTFEFDLQNYELANPEFGEAIQGTLNNTSFRLSSTDNNINNFPLAGQSLLVSFYVTYNDIERLQVSSSGEQYSKNKYAFVEDIRIDSGFRNLSGILAGTISAYGFTQPQTNTQYFSDYTYNAPKVGERLTFSYDYNTLLSDLIKVIEPVRPIGGDVLIKEKLATNVFLSATVAPVSGFTGTTVSLQNSVMQRLSTFINQQVSGSDIDVSDLINAAYAVPGLDRIIITQLNTTDGPGVMATIRSDELSYFVAKSVNITISEK